MTNVIAGPVAGRLLADLGADMIKFESPFGDISRPGGGAGFISYNAGKRSVSVDTKTRAGAEVARRLAASADLILANMATGRDRAHGAGRGLPAARQPAHSANPHYRIRMGRTLRPASRRRPNRAGADRASARAGRRGRRAGVSVRARAVRLHRRRAGRSRRGSGASRARTVRNRAEGGYQPARSRRADEPRTDSSNTTARRPALCRTQTSSGLARAGVSIERPTAGYIWRRTRIGKTMKPAEFLDGAEDALAQMSTADALDALSARGLPRAPVVEDYARGFFQDPQAQANGMIAELTHPASWRAET